MREECLQLLLSAFAASAVLHGACRGAITVERPASSEVGGAVMTGGAGDSSTGGGSVGAGGAAGGTVEPECPGVPSKACDDAELPVLLEASQFGEGIRFVRADGDAVLAEREVAPGVTEPFLIMLHDSLPSGLAVVELAVPSPVPLEARGVSSDFGPTTALLCSAAGCALYGLEAVAPPDFWQLVAIQGGEVPSTGELAGVATWQQNGAGNLACVYGDGVFCFDFDSTKWIEAVPSGSGARFNAGVDVWTRFWLAGNAGRLGFLEGDDWTAVPVATTANLGAVARHIGWTTVPWEVIAVGDAGTVVTVTTDGTTSCVFGDNPLVGVMVGWGWNDYEYGLIAANGGAYVSEDDGTWCEMKLANELVISAQVDFCGIAHNERVLTHNTLFGANICLTD